MKKITLLLLMLAFTNIYSQLKIKTSNGLKINHGDITLYLSNDTLSLVSVHVITYDNLNKLTHVRDDNWYSDTYNTYDRKYYRFSGYDLGHLTPSDITSYDKVTNHNSFSLYNQAPQLAGFNRGKWARLENSVYDTIRKYKKDAVVITGVIYDNNNIKYLPKSRIKIPVSYYKILTINKIIYCWIGSNINGEIIITDLLTLNKIFKVNKLNLNINL